MNTNTTESVKARFTESLKSDSIDELLNKLQRYTRQLGSEVVSDSSTSEMIRLVRDEIVARTK